MIYEIDKNSYGEIIFSDEGVKYYGIAKITLPKNARLVTDRSRVYIHFYGETIPVNSFLKKYIDLAVYKPLDLYDSDETIFSVVRDTRDVKLSVKDRIHPVKGRRYFNNGDTYET